ncbi:MAG: GNAT family N-acetyltransferase [Thermoplasmata archaeon]|nr:GNAT family N-acetyltransferase [Thermoplasmata archaeon]
MNPKGSEPRGHETQHPETAGAPVHLRPAEGADVPTLVSLLIRLKRLNEEFDPLLKVRPDAEAKAKEVLASDLKNPSALVVAVEGTGVDAGKVVGVVRAHIRERLFYTPEQEGVILDIYLLPLFRRKGVGEYVLAETTRLLKERGAGIVTAEFPVQNAIAVRFYAKRGFRPITALHARSV